MRLRRVVPLLLVVCGLSGIAGRAEEAPGSATGAVGRWVMDLDRARGNAAERVELALGADARFTLVSTPWEDEGAHVVSGRWHLAQGRLTLEPAGSEVAIPPAAWLPGALTEKHRAPDGSLQTSWAWLESGEPACELLQGRLVLCDGDLSSDARSLPDAPVVRFAPLLPLRPTDLLGTWAPRPGTAKAGAGPSLRFAADGRIFLVADVVPAPDAPAAGRWHLEGDLLHLNVEGRAASAALPLLVRLPPSSGGATLLALPGSSPEVFLWQVDAEPGSVDDRLVGTWLWVLEDWPGRSGTHLLGGLMFRLDPEGGFSWVWGHQEGVDQMHGTWRTGEDTLLLAPAETDADLPPVGAVLRLGLRCVGRERIELSFGEDSPAVACAKATHPESLCQAWHGTAEGRTVRVELGRDGSFSAENVRKPGEGARRGVWAAYRDLLCLVDASEHWFVGARYELSEAAPRRLRLLLRGREEVLLDREP